MAPVSGGIHQALSEHVVLKVNVLEAGKTGKREDLSKTTGSELLQNCSSCGVFLVCSGQYLSKVVHGRNSGEPASMGPSQGANISVPDTTAHIQGSSGVHALADQGCFHSKRETNTILGRWL